MPYPEAQTTPDTAKKKGFKMGTSENVSQTSEVFDVFLSHNSLDKPLVREIACRLKADARLRCWLDEEQLRPGRSWQKDLENGILASKSVAVFVGKNGLGPWENEEMRAALNRAVKNKLPVIPVLLPETPLVPKLPLFLEGFTWVDLRPGITEENLKVLIWGITGKKKARKSRGSAIAFAYAKAEAHSPGMIERILASVSPTNALAIAALERARRDASTVARLYHPASMPAARTSASEPSIRRVAKAAARQTKLATRGKAIRTRTGRMNLVRDAMRQTLHEALEGDTLASVGERYGVPVANLRKWNSLEIKAAKALRPLKPGTVLLVGPGRKR